MPSRIGCRNRDASERIELQRVTCIPFSRILGNLFPRRSQASSRQGDGPIQIDPTLQQSNRKPPRYRLFLTAYFASIGDSDLPLALSSAEEIRKAPGSVCWCLFTSSHRHSSRNGRIGYLDINSLWRCQRVFPVQPPRIIVSVLMCHQNL